MKTTPKPPKVQVFPPSKKECESKTDEKKMKTLVCLASGFYPDHVTVSWQIDGFNEKQGVKTNDAATMKDDGNYTIMSKLRITASKWLKKGTNITCIVSFFDGNNTVPYPNWTIGESFHPKYFNMKASKNVEKKINLQALLFPSGPGNEATRGN